MERRPAGVVVEGAQNRRLAVAAQYACLSAIPAQCWTCPGPRVALWTAKGSVTCSLRARCARAVRSALLCSRVAPMAAVRVCGSYVVGLEVSPAVREMRRCHTRECDSMGPNVHQNGRDL